jgi:hypothetical protein
MKKLSWNNKKEILIAIYRRFRIKLMRERGLTNNYSIKEMLTIKKKPSLVI